MTLKIHDNDALEFSQLGDDCRTEIREWLRAFHSLVNCTGKIGPAIDAAARAPRRSHRKRCAGCGTSTGTVAEIEGRKVFRGGRLAGLYQPREMPGHGREACRPISSRFGKSFANRISGNASRPGAQLIRGWKKQLFVLRDGTILTECPGYADWPAADPDGDPARAGRIGTLFGRTTSRAGRSSRRCARDSARRWRNTSARSTPRAPTCG
jgi:hypothetical protein